ncbi:MAG: hypothetical protein NTY37_11250 [Methanothrix sp.]|nr:hypothetical protein [Methanothrix sp.]
MFSMKTLTVILTIGLMIMVGDATDQGLITVTLNLPGSSIEVPDVPTYLTELVSGSNIYEGNITITYSCVGASSFTIDVSDPDDLNPSPGHMKWVDHTNPLSQPLLIKLPGGDYRDMKSPFSGGPYAHGSYEQMVYFKQTVNPDVDLPGEYSGITLLQITPI